MIQLHQRPRLRKKVLPRVAHQWWALHFNPDLPGLILTQVDVRKSALVYAVNNLIVSDILPLAVGFVMRLILAVHRFSPSIVFYCMPARMLLMIALPAYLIFVLSTGTTYTTISMQFR